MVVGHAIVSLVSRGHVGAALDGLGAGLTRALQLVRQQL